MWTSIAWSAVTVGLLRTYQISSYHISGRAAVFLCNRLCWSADTAAQCAENMGCGTCQLPNLRAPGRILRQLVGAATHEAGQCLDRRQGWPIKLSLRRSGTLGRRSRWCWRENRISNITDAGDRHLAESGSGASLAPGKNRRMGLQWSRET